MQMNDIYMNPDIFKMLSILDKKALLIDYIAKNISSSNHLIATYKDIANQTDLSPATVRSTMLKLQEKGIIERVQNGVWKVSKVLSNG